MELPSEKNSPLPVVAKERIQIIDSIRGIALLGILLMNIAFFANGPITHFNLNIRNEYSGPNYYSWWIVETGFEGTFRALFSMLFGAGSLLLLSRLERNNVINAADIYYRRMIWLLLFGFFNAYVLLWPGDILYRYAVCGLFLFPFRKLKAKYILMFALAFMIISTSYDTYLWHKDKHTRVKGEKVLQIEKSGGKLTPEQEEHKKAWNTYQESKSLDTKRGIAEGIKKGTLASYTTIFNDRVSINRELQSDHFYRKGFMDAIFFLFLGMALFKWGVITGQRTAKFYWILLAVGYGIGIPISIVEHQAYIDTRFDITKMIDILGIDYYQQRRCLISLGHLSFFMLLYKYNIAKLFLKWMARVGQMAFTNYLMQSIICGLIFYGFGFALYGRLERYEWYIVVLGVWIFQTIFSNIWLRYFLFGPFEWLWRSLTYWKKQPIKREILSA